MSFTVKNIYEQINHQGVFAAIMKILLLIFTLLVGNYRCHELKRLRNRLPMEKSEVARCMGTVSDDIGDYSILNSADIQTSFTRTTIGALLEESNGILNLINRRFGRAVVAYVKNRLLAICLLAIKKNRRTSKRRKNRRKES